MKKGVAEATPIEREQSGAKSCQCAVSSGVPPIATAERSVVQRLAWSPDNKDKARGSAAPLVFPERAPVEEPAVYGIAAGVLRAGDWQTTRSSGFGESRGAGCAGENAARTLHASAS